MHMSGHLKALGHEVQGSYYVGGKRKKPENPDEVGAVKDHFAEGRQQDNRREQNGHAEPALPDTKSFEDAESATFDIYQPRKSQYASPVLAAELAAETIRSLFKDVAHELKPAPTAATPHKEPAEPSFDELLALMRVAFP